MRTTRLPGLAAVLATGLFVAPVSVAAFAQARLVVDIPYVADADPAQRLDLRVPADVAGPLPVVVLVHGGGWSGGDKSGADKPNSGADITPWFEPLADAGFLVVSINYRLAPAHRWPACLDDTRAALRWVRDHIAEHGGDPARVAVMGHSAGGQLALLAAMPAGASRADGDHAPVAAVVGCAPVSDFLADVERRGGLSRSLQDLHGFVAEPTPEALEWLRATSPITRVAAGFPPTLLLHGEADKTVPLAQSRAFAARARELGVECELFVVAGAGHRLTEWDAHDPAWARVLTDWLRARLDAGANRASTSGATGEVNNAPVAPLIPTLLRDYHAPVSPSA